MEKHRFFTYGWHIDEDEEDITSIRVYGINKENENVCVRVNNFTPYVYLELPERIQWTEARAQMVGNKLDELTGKKKPLSKCLVYKKKLYGAHMDKNNKPNKVFPFMFCKFSTRGDIKNLGYKLRRKINVTGLGQMTLKMHEQNADPILQLTCCRELPTAGWVDFHGKRMTGDKKVTLCDHEFVVRWKHLFKCDEEGSSVAKPMIMGYDIEVNSSNPAVFPDADKPGDKVFQISCVFYREGDPIDEYTPYLLSLGDPDQETTGEEVIINRYETEADLLEGFCELIRDENPNLIAGYNILGFDIPYMIGRAKHNLCIHKFDQQGFHKFGHASEKTIKWSSSAYKNQEFQFLDAEGRVYIDLLPLVKRDYKLGNYKLKTISTHFLGQTKDPLSVKGIFKCYRIGMKGGKKGSRALGVVGKYCVQDSVLVIRLMDHLQTWVGLCEMAKTCAVPIFVLYTQGQQIKVFSQVYKFCMYDNKVVEKDGYVVKDDERYVGAHVFDPVPGCYDVVLPFDFASLYPTTIIAYNIDYSTWVTDDSIPDSDCHVMIWEDHVGCCHDPKVVRKVALTKIIDSATAKVKLVRAKRNNTLDKYRKKELMDEINSIMEDIKPYRKERSDLNKSKPKHIMCSKRNYRFLKEPKGVIPTILQNLLDARANTRKEIKVNKTRINKFKESDGDHSDEIQYLTELNKVLNKRQLAYKISANSMYGAMGVPRGYLPFMPGAMCTTYMGRVNIEKVADVIPKKYGGELVYGDTDTLLPDSPLLISNNGRIEYRTMEELSDGNWKKTVTGKEISLAEVGLMVWSDIGFTPIKYVIRHAITKPLIRVTTHTGSVRCTLDHSLLWENGEAAKASDVKLGSNLCISEFPLPEDTPTVPIYENKLTDKKIQDYVIPEIYLHETGFSAEMAFVWGVFYADGSCGTYKRANPGNVSTWAINNQDNKLLQRCSDILNRHVNGLTFRILNTMKSSGVNKLTATSTNMIKPFVEKYRKLFYDCRRSKRIPSIIFNCPFDIRQSFFMGYYAGDGSKKDPSISCSNKGAIGTAGLFYLMRTIGYKVSVNTRKDKPSVYKLTGSSPNQKFRYKANTVKKIEDTCIYNNTKPLITPLNYEDKPEYIYDIETINHHFAAGVGQLVVHNSNYIHFPHLKTAQEAWDHAEYVAAEVTKMFPKPIKLEFEEVIYWRFFILTKKRYMYLECLRDGNIGTKVGKKGVLLARRDTCSFIRNIYESVISKVFNRDNRDDILYFVLQEINRMCSHTLPTSDFVVSKGIGSVGDLRAVPFINEKGKKKAMIGDYTVPILSSDPEERKHQYELKGVGCAKDYYLKCLPAQVQLGERMKSRGQRADAGSRIEYVVSTLGGHKAKQYVKVESAEYFTAHGDVLGLDYMYYLKLLSNPMDQVISVAYFKKSQETKFLETFVLDQYKFRLKVRTKVLNELKSLFAPVLTFSG